MQTFMWNEIMEQPDILSKTIEKSDFIINKLIKEINEKNINMVGIAARGTSDHAAIYAKYIIEIVLKIPVYLASPSVFTIYNTNIKMDNMFVIGISQSGKAQDVVEVIDSAKEQGALTATITNFEDSPLAKSGKYHIFCNSGEEKSVAATKTFTSQLAVLLKLVAKWAGSKELINSLNHIPKKIQETIHKSDKILSKIERYRYMDECFVLARGVNYAIALESALKIQETSYTRAKAYAVSDFYHGPYAMIEKDMPVMVYAPKGKAFNNVKEMIEKLIKSSAELIIISNDSTLKNKCECFLEIPETDNDIISPFFNIVVAQIFACKLAIIKGLNPDIPRSLSKITITR